MNKALIIHALWAVVAITSFVVGAQYFAGDAMTAAHGDSGKSGGAGASGGSTGPVAGAYHPRPASRNSRSAGVPDLGEPGRVNLSEQGIKSLGNILQTSNNPIERRIAFAKLLEGLTVENAELLREQITHMSSDSPEWKDFHYAWGALAGQSVVEFGAKSEQKDMAAAFSGWASANPQAALSWFNSQSTEDQNRRDLKWGAVYGLANTDPRVATDFAMQRLEMGDKDAGHMMNLIARAVMKSGSPEEAARWSASVPEGKLRDVAVSQVARGYADEDPSKAVSWLQTLPEGNGKALGFGMAFSTWAARDAEAAGNHLNQMNDSPERDSAVTGFTRRIAYQNPRAAVDWASTITDPKMRNETLVHSGRAYLRKDREAARQWLASSNLSAEVQKRIIGPGKRK
ncbi:MAG: hypothetical protein H7A51_17380 [Akkermansiaceae bacterium]|nr:hypothetical protein [Akkermansiaceae bacterium]